MKIEQGMPSAHRDDVSADEEGELLGDQVGEVHEGRPGGGGQQGQVWGLQQDL